MDKSYFQNPILEYFKWLFTKIKIQSKYKGKHIKIGYKSIVNNTTFEEYNWIANDVYLNRVNIGSSTYIAANTVILNAEIGKFCSIGPNIRIAPGIHPTNTYVSTHPSMFSRPDNLSDNFFTGEQKFVNSKMVKIGNDVWIGANAVIIDGVEISDGAIIAANAVVVKNVGPYEIHGGVPAKLIKKRFSELEIDKLLKIQWWNKDRNWIKNNIRLFDNIEKMISGND